jgi:hypothetical protein
VKKQKSLWVNTIKLDIKSEGKKYINLELVWENRKRRYEEEYLWENFNKIQKEKVDIEPIVKGSTKLCNSKIYKCKQETDDCECSERTIESRSKIEMSCPAAATKINYDSIIDRQMQNVESI